MERFKPASRTAIRIVVIHVIKQIRGQDPIWAGAMHAIDKALGAWRQLYRQLEPWRQSLTAAFAGFLAHGFALERAVRPEPLQKKQSRDEM